MLTALLLAAGEGTRFGGGKMLARLPDGMPLGLRAAARLAPVVSDLRVVVRAEDAATATAFETAGHTVVRCPDAALGMAHSLACGIRASADSAAWLVALGDMPAIAHSSLVALIAQWRARDRIVVPVHGGALGHPVIFPARYRDELLALRGDRGARAVLNAHRDDVDEVALDDPGVLRDIDTPADLPAA